MRESAVHASDSKKASSQLTSSDEQGLSAPTQTNYRPLRDRM